MSRRHCVARDVIGAAHETAMVGIAVLANLVVNNATRCTGTQFIVLWVLIGLFCVFNFALCFTDSIVRPAFPPTDKNDDKTPANTTYTVILLPGWIMPIRLIRRYRAMVKRRAEGAPRYSTAQLRPRKMVFGDAPQAIAM